MYIPFFSEPDIEHWMREYVGSSSGGSCWSTGYHTLTNHWQGVTITSGGGGYSGYSDYEWCYWAFYAPGAQHLRFEMKRMRVNHSPIIFLKIFFYRKKKYFSSIS